MFESLIPRGKMGRPEEITTIALFLASDDSSYVNGWSWLSTAASRPSESAGNQKSACERNRSPSVSRATRRMLGDRPDRPQSRNVQDSS